LGHRLAAVGRATGYCTMNGAAQQTPIVSVVMGVHNEASEIVTTLESVFAQSLSDLECVVVDDGSTDDTVQVINEAFAEEPRLRLVVQPEQDGLTRALVAGVTAASGTWLARIDAGDTWHPEKLARQVEFLNGHPEVGIVGCATEETNLQTGQVSIRRKPETSAAIEQTIWRACPFIHPTIVARLDLVRQCGGYDPAYPCSQDYDLYFRLLALTNGYNLPEPLACRPTHGERSISYTRWKDQVRCTLRIRWYYLRERHMPLACYRVLVPLLLKLLLPGFLKGLKQRLTRSRS